MGSYECDDGNNNDKDGCSSDCRIEDGFSCAQRAGDKDYCFKNTPIEVKLIIGKANANATIKFERDIAIKQNSRIFSLSS